ncbi:unnamed protein product [Orchesella dallaii]|uniref:protein-serine/threonine phosphatase n=1 Tax=Orchesella dallaii TaxID=48710 RepID=A0ABP1S8R5_9HEXA
MGAYLSEPMTAKETEEGEGNKLKFGACSMQGWRVSQEDAHNCIASFDQDASLFAVYDGHGGSEVATYLSRHLPEFLKTCTAYKNGEFVKGLEECYLKIDESIKTPEVIKEIQQIAKSSASNEAGVDYEEENVGALYEEATMPLDKLVAKYQSVIKGKLKEIEGDGDCKPGSSKEAVKAGSSKSGGSAADGSSSSGGSGSSKRGEANGESSADDKAVSSSSSSPGEQTKTETEDSCDLPSSTSVGELIVEGKSISIEPAKAKNAKEDDAGVGSSSETKSLEPQSTTAVNGNGTASEDDGKVEKAKEKSSDSEATSTVTVNGGVSASDAKPKLSSDGKSAEAEGKSSESEAASKETVNGGKTSDAVSVDSSTAKEAATPTSSETPRRKKAQPVLVKIEDSKPERRSPRKTQQKSFDCSDSDDSDEDDAGYSMDDSDSSEDLDDEEEDLEGESSSNDDEDDDDDEDDYDDEDAEEDERFLSDIQEPGYDSGATAVVGLMKWEADGLSLWVANAGDSRCVVCREGKAVDMSYDHKPELEEEAKRIIKAGGKVTQEGRVNGGLNLSRAIGDHSYKQNATLPLEEQMISPLPSIEHIVLNPAKDKFIVLACDGVWNSMTSQEVVDFVDQRLVQNKPLPKICEELFDACLAPDTCGDGTGCDNMTAIIVQLSDAPQVFSGSKRRCSEEPAEESESTKKSRVD